jgi:heparan-alpha-glucosaminide N-acetyltransferase
VLLVLVEYLPPSASYRWLRHSPWGGMRVADIVFPGFLFVVGASMSVAARRPSWLRVGRRTVVLLALGVAFNAATETSPLRYTGVLQTIAVAGLLAAVVIALAPRTDAVAWVAGALLVAHGALLSHSFDVDRAVFADAHLYKEGLAGHDPEGILNTVLGATAVVLLGWVAMRWRSMAFVGVLLAIAAASWTVWEPNKRAWTPTFALLVAAGCAAVLVARVEVPVLGAIGRNALLVYVGQHVVREIWLSPTTYLHLGSGPRSLLAYTAIATVAWSTVAIVLGRVGIRLRT